MLPRLIRGSAQEILARLSSDDPLRLLPLGAKRTRERFLLFDADRVFERLAARVAYAGAQADPRELNLAWLVQQTDHVLDHLIEEEREEEVQAPFDCNPEDTRYPFLRSLWIDPRYTRAASLAFNTSEERVRKAFYYLMLEKRTVQETLALGSWSEEELMRDSWRAIGALGLHDLNARPDPTWQLAP